MWFRRLGGLDILFEYHAGPAPTLVDRMRRENVPSDRSEDGFTLCVKKRNPLHANICAGCGAKLLIEVSRYSTNVTPRRDSQPRNGVCVPLLAVLEIGTGYDLMVMRNYPGRPLLAHDDRGLIAFGKRLNLDDIEILSPFVPNVVIAEECEGVVPSLALNHSSLIRDEQFRG